MKKDSAKHYLIIKINQFSQKSSSRQSLPRSGNAGGLPRSRCHGWRVPNTSLCFGFRQSLPERRCCWSIFIIRNIMHGCISGRLYSMTS